MSAVSSNVADTSKDRIFFMKTNLKRSLVSLASAVLLVSCATSGGPVGEDPSVTVTDLTELPIPRSSGFTEKGDAEVVRPLDVLSISVFGVEELSREEVRIGLEGAFDYPLIGVVEADGRSLTQISDDMEARLAGTYVLHPDIQLAFVSRDGQVFTIGGEVEQPGQYPILQSTTLQQAVAIGGGRTDYSQLREVVVSREVDGQQYIGVYDLEAIQRGNYPDPKIYPHDVIMVGESPVFRRIARLAQFVPLITNPLILLDRVTR